MSPDYNPEQNDVRGEESMSKTTRRGALAALGLGGLAALGGGSASAQSVGGSDADSASEFLSRLYAGAEEDIPEPVNGRSRFWHVTSGGTQYNEGDLLIEGSESWSPINLGVESLDADSVSTEKASIHGGGENDFNTIVNANAGLTVEGHPSDRHWAHEKSLNQISDEVTIDIDGLVSDGGKRVVLDFERMRLRDGDGEIHATINTLGAGEYNYRILDEPHQTAEDYWVMQANASNITEGFGEIHIAYENNFAGLRPDIGSLRARFDPVVLAGADVMTDPPSQITFEHSVAGNEIQVTCDIYSYEVR